MSASRRPWPSQPWSYPPWPGSITTVLPDSRGPAWRTASEARSASGRPPVAIGRIRSSALNVDGPQVPSAGRPRLRWNSVTARWVSAAKIPSIRATANPSSWSRDCSDSTSSPLSGCAGTKVSSRSPSRQRASSSARYVCGPTIPSTTRPRCCWKPRTATAVSSSNIHRRRSSSNRSRWSLPMISATASPLSPTWYTGPPYASINSPASRATNDFAGRKSGGELGQFLEQRRLRLGADDGPSDLTVHVHIDRRDAGHPVVARGHRVLVDVHLHERDLVAVLSRDLVENRVDLAARSAPLGPEVDQDRLVALQDGGLEVGVGHCIHLVAHGDLPYIGSLSGEVQACTATGSAASTAPASSASACSSSARYRSASSAAAQPVPAAVTACRYVWSTRSPAANTPVRLVLVLLPSTST